MKNETLLHLLMVTPEQYEDKTMDNWVNWCITRVRNPKNLQKLLINKPLLNWWKKELEKLEMEFIEDMKLINEYDPRACRRAYDFTIRKIYNRFSKPLIKKAHDS